MKSVPVARAVTRQAALRGTSGSSTGSFEGRWNKRGDDSGRDDGRLGLILPRSRQAASLRNRPGVAPGTLNLNIGPLGRLL